MEWRGGEWSGGSCKRGGVTGDSQVQVSGDILSW